MRDGAGAARAATASVLFTDLVGSTELRVALGEVAADTLQRAHDALLAKAVADNGGRVVKGLGDGIMATFAATADAVAAAVAIQQAARRHSDADPSQPLHVRVGVSVGDVVCDSVDCFGTPVVEASRLCAAADGGQILVTETVRLLARARSAHDFLPVGVLHLKGLPEPIPACEVPWTPLPTVGPLAHPTVPFPALLDDHGGLPLAGRQEELETVVAAWKQASAGDRRVALVGGEPGIGKTRLAAEVARRAHEAGAVVLLGRCDDGMGVPYQPFVEALQQVVAADGAVVEQLGRHPGELVRLVPELADRWPGLPPPLRSDAETERYRLFDSVASWLVAMAEPQGAVLVLDDLHWADRPTLLLLRHLTRATEPARLLVVGTYRDTDLDRTHPLAEVLADLRREPAVERLSLDGLDEAGVEELVVAAAGHELDDDTLGRLGAALRAETEGNPFFVRQVLRHLAESGTIYQRDGRWTTDVDIADLGMPEGVREVIGRRLGRLSPEANDVLRAASIIGREFELEILRELVDVGEDALLAALEEGLRTRLVVETSVDRYRFAHALVVSVLHDEHSVSRRVRLHRRVAEALERRHPEEVAALAHHFGLAAPGGDVDKAVEYATRAASAAAAQLAHDEAARWYRHALELLDDAGEGATRRRCRLLIGLGEAQRLADQPSYRQVLFDAARLAQRLGDGEALADAALANSRGGIWSAAGRVDWERIEVLESALEVVDDDCVRRARLLAGVALELAFSPDHERRLRLSDEALAIARRCDDVETRCDVLLARANALPMPSTLDERLGSVDEMVGLALASGDPHRLFRVAGAAYTTCLQAGQLANADRWLAEVDRLAAELGQPMLRWMAEVYRAGRLILAGRFEEAEASATRGLELGGAANQPDAAVWFAGQLATVWRLRGRSEELMGIAEVELEANPGLPAWRAVLAMTYCEVGRLDDAAAVLADLAARRFADLPLDVVWLTALDQLAEVASRVGDAEAAAVLEPLLAPYADQVVGFPLVWHGSLRRGLGLLATTLGRRADAEDHFRRAAETNRALCAPGWVACTELDHAALLARLGQGEADRAEAQALATSARATAASLGMATVEARAASLLGQLG